MNMNILDVIKDEECVLDAESELVGRQRKVVDDLYKQYEEQLAILHAIETRIGCRTKILYDLRKAADICPKVHMAVEVGDDFRTLLSCAYNSMCTDGWINSRSKNMVVANAKKCIQRACPHDESYEDFLKRLTPDKIKSLRNCGERTAALLIHARETLLLNEQAEKGEASNETLA